MDKEKEHPASTRPVYFRTKFVQDEDTGDWEAGWHKGFYLKDANKYVRNVNRWKDTEHCRWYNDSDVVDWKEQEHGRE